MARLIDSSLWIDFSRARSPKTLRQIIAPHVLNPDAHLAEPITFEVLRYATPVEFKQLTQQFMTMPTLPTPPSLWTDATALGQACRQKNVTVKSLDLVIAAIAIAHGAEIVTFDEDFQQIASASALQVKLLKRPTA